METVRGVEDTNEEGKPAALTLRSIASHQLMLTTTEEQALYLLLQIAPAADLPPVRLPLNLCLVLDRSTSMQGTRLQQVREATRQIIDRLQPDDALSVVVFSDRAEVLLPSQRNVDKPRARASISCIQAGGGTEMLQGLLAGLGEIERGRTTTSINHLIILTDGQTYGDEPGCLEQARWAGSHQISLSPMGIGDDWNDSLLDEMASLSGGSSAYIDSPRRVMDALGGAIQHLKAAAARQMTISVVPSSGVHLHEMFLVVPQIQRLPLVDNTPARYALLGPLGTDQGRVLLLEFRVQAPLVGRQRLAQLTIRADIPAQLNRRAWSVLDLMADFSPAASSNIEVPPAIIAVLSKLAIFKMQEKMVRDVDAGDIGGATQRLEAMAARLLNLGETELARSTLLEAGRLVHSGALSAEGRKKIRYGTRALTTLPQELVAGLNQLPRLPGVSSGERLEDRR
jgi:hypothetical protein